MHVCVCACVRACVCVHHTYECILHSQFDAVQLVWHVQYIMYSGSSGSTVLCSTFLNLCVQPNRTYYLEDPTGNSQAWSEAIEKCMKLYKQKKKGGKS